MSTALDLFREALALTNSVGSDQVLTDQEAEDCLSILNDVIEDWSTQSLAVYGIANQTFNTSNGAASYTIGTTGVWVTSRPIRIDQPAYSVINGASFPCVPMTQGEYNLITVKTQPNAYPYRYLFVNDYPLGIITLWPVPNAITPITFSIERQLTQVAALTTVLSFPPGYKKALKYALAVEGCSIFGGKINEFPEVISTANKSLANIKRANQSQRKRVMRSGIEYSDMQGGHGTPYDWMVGQ